MAKGRGPHHRKKEARRSRHGRHAGGLPLVSAAPAQAAAAPQRGVAATRGPVSAAYRAWATDYGRRQAQAVAAQFGGPAGVPAELFVLAPLTTRTVEAPGGVPILVQMGLPIVATRAGGITVAPDRLGVAVLRLPEADAGSAMAMLGLGQAPEMPQPDLLFAAQLPGEGLRGVRPADAVAWYLAGAIEAGDVAAEARALAAAAGEALALLRPNVAPREAPRLDPTALDAYEGYGFDADEDAVPPNISAPPARGGLAGLPSGPYVQDTGAPLAPLLADLHDYVVGLWPYDYFGLEALTAEAAAADGARRGATLAALADLVRRLDDVLAQSSEAEEEALAAEGHPPAWIAAETAHYREARQALRESRAAQELLPRLGPILFELEIPPPDYVPEGWEQEQEEGQED